MYKVTDKSGTINYYFDTMNAAKAALPCIKLTGDKFTISEIKPDILNTSTIEAVAVISKPSNIMSCIDFRPVYLTDPMIDGSEYEINMHYKDMIFSVSEFNYCASCRMRVKVGDLSDLHAEKERIKGELMDASKPIEELMQQTCNTIYSIKEDDNNIVFDDRGNIFIKPKPDVNPYEHNLGIGDNVENVVMTNKDTVYRFKSYRRKL